MIESVNKNTHHFFLICFVFSIFSLWSLTAEAEEQVTVKQGQTLIKIMRQVYPDQRSKWPVLMREIVQANPASFENGDPRTLKVGTTLILPEKSTAKKTSKKRVRAGVINSVSGSVTVFDDKKKSTSVKAGNPIYVGDQLLTSDAGSVSLSLIDGAELDLRCNSLLNIEQYKMRTRGSQAALTLLKGSLSTRTGRIGKRGNDQYQLKTPVGNITTTAAEYGIRVHQAQGCEKQADVETDGLYLAVLNGEVMLSNEAGELKIASGDAALSKQPSVAPVITTAFSGMVYGDKIVVSAIESRTKPVKKVTEPETEEPLQQDNGVPYWWMIAAAVILGFTF